MSKDFKEKTVNLDQKNSKVLNVKDLNSRAKFKNTKKPKNSKELNSNDFNLNAKLKNLQNLKESNDLNLKSKIKNSEKTLAKIKDTKNVSNLKVANAKLKQSDLKKNDTKAFSNLAKTSLQKQNLQEANSQNLNSLNKTALQKQDLKNANSQILNLKNQNSTINFTAISQDTSSQEIISTSKFTANSQNQNLSYTVKALPKIQNLTKNPTRLNLLDFTKEELEEIISPRFRVKQIFEWIYQKYADDFSQMSSLPRQMRENLSEKFHFSPLQCMKFEQSADKSIKYLFRLNDGLLIESVLLPMKPEILDEKGRVLKHTRYTICISSQVGCKSGCAFCLTAKGGFKRNLTAGEIVAQVLWIKKQNKLPYERRVNLVYMGMGEPLDNLKNVAKAVRILSDNSGLAISVKRQTISTSGLARQIKELGELDLGVLLAISLHAVNDKLRSELMPINKAYNIAAIMDAVRNFPINARKRVMFEYLLIDGVNDDLSQARELVRLLNGIKAKVNLILFNPHEKSPYKRPSLEKALSFQDFLSTKGISCTIRQSKGLDISAACGQLKERSINNS